jgi:tetratricopeptide (TPR) repeat protein
MAIDTARAFISSTFQDMHAERDVLSRKVFPALRRRFEARGLSVAEIDLRWGITAEDANNEGVLRLCLDEIDRCRPFFVAMLGGRYGWIDPHAARLLKERYPSLSAYADRSVTELEIRHAVLNRPSQQAVLPLIYIRDDAAADPAVARLASELQATVPNQCRHYRSPEELAAQLECDLAVSLETWADGERTSNGRAWRSLKAARLQGAIARPQLESALERAIAKPGSRVGLVGLRGCGKTTLLAMFAQRQQERPAGAPGLLTRLLRGRANTTRPARWLLHAQSALGRSLDWRAPVRDVLVNLEGDAAPPPDESEALLQRTREALLRTSVEEQLVLCLDGLDDLQAGGSAELSWLKPLLGARVTTIAACSDERLRKGLHELGFHLIEVPPWTASDAAHAAEAYLGSFGKKLSPAQARALCGSASHVDPALLRLRLDELRLFGRFEQLDAEAARLGALQTLSETVGAVLARVESDVALKGTAAADLLQLVVLSREGLTDAELLQLLAARGHALKQADLSGLLLTLEPVLACRAGRWCFSSAPLGQCVQDLLGPTDADSTLVNHFGADPGSARAAAELPALFVRRADWRALAGFLSDPHVLDTLAKHGGLGEALPLATLVERELPGELAIRLPAVLHAGAQGAASWHAGHLAGLLMTRLGYTAGLAALLEAQHLACTDPQGRVALLRLLADLELAAGDQASARKRLQSLRDSLNPARDFSAWAACSRALVSMLLAAEDHQSALHVARELSVAADATRDPLQQAMVTGLLGGALLGVGELAEAERLLHEQKAYAERYGDLQAAQSALGNLGLLARQRRRPREALRLHEQEEAICRSLGDQSALHICLGHQAVAALDLGQADHALDLLQAKLALASSLADMNGQVDAYLGQSEVFRRLGQRDVARRLLDAARPLAARTGRLRRLDEQDALLA